MCIKVENKPVEERNEQKQIIIKVSKKNEINQEAEKLGNLCTH